MPRDLTHILFAEDIASHLPTQMQQQAKLHRTAFYMGVISHDSFLYGSDSKLGTKIHGGLGDDTRKIVLTMLNDIRQQKDPVLRAQSKAFVQGYLTHMAVDSVFHPFVYSVAGSQMRSNNPDEEHVKLAKTRHRYVETWLDMHFLKDRNHRLSSFNPLKRISEDSENRDRVSEFFCKNYQKAFHIKEDLTSKYKTGMTVQLFIGRVTKNQTLGKILRRLDDFLDGRLGMAVSGFYQKDREMPEKLKEFDSFKHPVTGQTVSKTLPDLTRDAVRRGTEFILAAEKYIQDGNQQEFLKAVPNINLDTGIENTKLSDIKQTEPLPVEELKGQKLRKFAQKGFKTFPSGARSLKNGNRKAAYPEVQKYTSADKGIRLLKYRQNQGR